MVALHYSPSFSDTVTLGGKLFKVLMSVQNALLWKQDRLAVSLCMWCLFFVLILCIDGFSGLVEMNSLMKVHTGMEQVAPLIVDVHQPKSCWFYFVK